MKRKPETTQAARRRIQALAVLIGLCCGGVAFAQTVHNVTQQTDHFLLQDALSEAADGDVIEIDAGTLFEDNIRFPNSIDMTIRGAGKNLTFINGGSGDDESPIFDMQNTGQTVATVISDLTLTNGVNTVLSGGGAARMTNTSPVFRNVDFVDNRGPANNAGAAHLLANNGASPRFENCAFLSGSSAFDSIGLNDGPTTMINCLVVAGATATCIKFDRGEHNLINCTIVARSDLHQAIGSFGGANVSLSNTIVRGVLTSFAAGQNTSQINSSRSLFQGATGDNIDGLATFADAEDLDFRLAAGSLGIDAGDNALLPTGAAIDIQELPRIVDDPATADTGRDGCAIVDIGAFEFQSFTDGDEDGIEDACDVCLGDNNTGDADADGICDEIDLCDGDDGQGDADEDGVCDDLDLCDGDDASGDSDQDGVCDDRDVCAGDDSLVDTDSDGDGINDCEDAFPDDPFDGLGGPNQSDDLQDGEQDKGNNAAGNDAGNAGNQGNGDENADEQGIDAGIDNDHDINDGNADDQAPDAGNADDQGNNGVNDDAIANNADEADQGVESPPQPLPPTTPLCGLGVGSALMLGLISLGGAKVHRRRR